MKVFVEPDDIYLHTSSVDFRKSINGLLAIVELELDASSGALFIFCNKKKTN
jgi:transposase